MRYSEIISEGTHVYDKESRRQGSTLATMIKECSGTISNYKSGARKLYRGAKNSTGHDNTRILKMNPSKHPQREAANFHYDYYTEVFDKLPSWDGVHSRAKSIIASSYVAYASAFGSIVMIVVPIDNATVYELPVNDFWHTQAKSMADPDGGYHGSRRLDHYLEDGKMIKDKMATEEGRYLISKQLAPEALGVKQHTASTMQLGEDHECWIGERCYFVSIDLWDKLIAKGKL